MQIETLPEQRTHVMQRLVLVMVFFLFFVPGLQAQVTTSTATVTSDKDDYAPRSNAIFTGAGFSPGEAVVLKVKNLNRPCNTVSSDSSYLPWTVIADANGGFITNWTVCDCNGDSLRLKATGQISGMVAYEYFTDAAVTTPATGGTNISADNAKNAGAIPTLIGNIIIAENLKSDFGFTSTSQSRTIILSAPTGWEFEPSTVSVSHSNGNDIGTSSISGTTTQLTVTLTSLPSGNVTNKLDVFTISGIKVIAINGANIPSSGNITYSGGTLPIAGLVIGTDLGLLSQGVGSAKKLAFKQQPTSANLNSLFSPVVTVQVQDQFDNAVSISRTVGLTINNSGSLGGTISTTTNSNGLATFNNIFVGSSGTYNLTAIATGLPSLTNAISAQFTITDPCVAASITTQPSLQPINYGSVSQVSISVTASGTSPNTQWQLSTDNGANWNNISGASSATFVLNNPTVSMSGNKYRCVVSNTCGTETSNAATLTVNSKAITISGLTANNKVYNGSNSATFNTTSAQLTGIVNSDNVILNSSGATGTFASIHVGNGISVLASGFALSGIAAGNYSLSQPSGLTANITPATANASVTVGSTYTYNGTAQGATASLVTGVGGALLANTITYGGRNTTVYGPSATAPTNAGDYIVTVALATSETNYIAVSDSKTFAIDKAASTTVVAINGGSFIYNGATHTPATVLVTGAGGLNLTPTAGYSNNINAGTATASYTFSGDNNHDGSSDTKDFTIGKAGLTVSANNKTRMYDEANPILDGILTGVVSGDGITAIYGTTATQSGIVGTYPITATLNDPNNKLANYQVINNPGILTITPAFATINLTDLAKTYNGAAQGTTVSTIPAGLSVNVTYAGIPSEPANAGSYAVVASLNNSNYAAVDATGTLEIGRAATTTTVTVASGPFTYNGSAHIPATVTVTGAGGLNLTPAAAYSNNTNAGTATASYSFEETANYLASSDSKTFEIGKAIPVVAVTVGGPFIYDNTAKAVSSATVTGVGGTSLGAATVVYKQNNIAVSPVNAGSYGVHASFAGNRNYEPATNNSETLTIGKASATIYISAYNGTYDGALHTASGAATGVNGENLSSNLSFASGFTTVPGGSTAWTFDGGTNYNDASGNAAVNIGKATATVTMADLNQTYNGNARTISATTSPAGLAVDITYDGFATAPVNAGSYAVTGIINDNNYQGSANAMLLVQKTAPVITWSAPAGITYGTALSDTELNAAANVAGILTYTPAAGTFLNAGENQTLSVSFTPTDAGNYTTAGTDVILDVAKANAVIIVNGYIGTFNGAAHGATGMVTGARGENLNSLLNLGASYPNVPGGTANWSFAGDENHNSAAGTVEIVLGARAIAIAADPQSKTYGDADPNLTYQITFGDLAGTDFFTGSLKRIAGENVGAYAIVQGTLALNDNYNLSFSNADLTINAKPVTVMADAKTKIFGDPDPALTYQLSSGSLIGSDAFSGALSRGAGESVGSYAISSTLENSNYAVTYVPAYLTIGAKAITAFISASDKVYDGTEVASATGSATGVNGAPVAVTVSNANFAAANAGSHTVTANVSIADNNYSLTSANASTTAAIMARPITVSANAGQSKVYGANDPVISYTPSEGLIAGNSFTGALSRAAGETVTAGPYSFTIGTLSAGSNYNVILTGSNTFAISAKPLTASISASDKIYDGLTTASATGSVPAADVISGDVVEVSVSNANFDTKQAVASKTVTARVSISNGNYALTSPTATTQAAILPKAIAGAFTAENKVYDGNSDAAILTRSLPDGVVPNDGVSLSGGTGSFNNEEVGTGKTVTLTGSTLTGPDAGNYSLSGVATAQANITALEITGSFTAESKIYDGGTNAVISGRTINGQVSGDAVALTGGTAAFWDKNVGTGKLVALTGAALSGADAGNYSLAPVLDATANIIAKDITGSFSSANKVYDGDVTAAANNRAVTGKIGADDLFLSGGTAAFENAMVGTGKTVTLSGAGLTGSDAGNYNLVSVATTTANITAKEVTATVTVADKVYDGQTNAAITSRSLHGIVGTDDVHLGTSGIATFADAEAGSNINVSVTGLALNGTAIGNYSLAAATVSTFAAITQADAVINIVAYNATFDGDAHTASGTAFGVGGAELTNSLSFATNYTNVPGGNTNWSFNGGNNYKNASGTAAVTISKANATISITPFTGTYDGASHTASGTATGVKNANLSNNLTFSTNYHSVPGGSTNWSFAGGTNYNNVSGSAPVAISARPITLTSDVKSKTYGNADPAFSAQVTAGTVVIGDGATGSLTRVTGENVGAYAINQGTYTFGNNYAETYQSADLTIGKRAITITADAKTKIYGDAEPALTAQVTNLVSGDVATGFLTRNAGENIGNYAINQAGFTFGANYTETFVPANLTIAKAALTITASNAARLYGDANPAFTGTFSGQKHNETFTIGGSTAALITSPTGQYSIIPSVTGATLANYNVIPVNGTLTINSAPLAVIVNSASRIYGDANPTLSGTVNGIKNGDAIAANYSTTANLTSPVGNYTITANPVGPNLSNYAVSVTNGLLNVTPAALTITAANKSRLYGDANPTFSGAYAGAKNGESFTVGGSTVANATTVIGTYPIVPSVSGATLTNYLVTPVNGTLTINEAPLVINVANKSREYGLANPTLTGSVSGIKNGDLVIENYSTTATQFSGTGQYPITAAPTGARLYNYSVTVNNGLLTIGQAMLTVTALNKTVQYSDTVTFKATFTGFRNGEGLSAITGLPAYLTSANVVNKKVLSPAGSYSITPCKGTLSAGNYLFTFVPATLTVEKEDATVTYTGLEYFTTENSTSGLANVEFMANLQDDNDGTITRGNISNAIVDFWTDASLNVANPLVLKDNPVGLVNPADQTSGAARTGMFTVTLGSNEIRDGGTTFEINAEVNAKTVDQFYNGSTLGSTAQTLSTARIAGEKTLITIALPGKDYVNGGGHLVSTNSFGTYAATTNSKVNFGFTMKWNKSGKNIQGQTNIVFRRLENGIWKTYKIKSNAINSLGTANVTGGRRADFNTKATLTDVTNELNPITISGNLDLSVQAFESTDPAFPNEISITLRNGNQVMFCSHWVNNNPARKGLGNGSIKILNSTPTTTARIANTTVAPVKAEARLESYPNPFSKSATIKFALETEQQFELAIYDMRGYQIKMVASGKAEAGKVYEYNLEGEKLTEGMYFVRLITANGVQVMKVMKSKF